MNRLLRTRAARGATVTALAGFLTAALYKGTPTPIMTIMDGTSNTILLAERMWKKNRAGAVVVMAVINGAMAGVAMHNMHNAKVLGN